MPRFSPRDGHGVGGGPLALAPRRSGAGLTGDDEGEPLFDSDDDVIWDLTQAPRPPAEIEAEALRMGYVAPAERDDSSTGGSTVDLT